MTELTYTVPVTGEKVTVAEPLVDTALTQIKTVVNGKIGSLNLESNAVEANKIKAEAVTGAKVNKEVPKITGAYGAQTERASATEFEPSAARPTLVIFEAVMSGTEHCQLEVQVGGKEIGQLASPKPSDATAPILTLTFLVPAAVKWQWVASAGVITGRTYYLTL